jgi:hypothetical protein
MQVLEESERSGDQPLGPKANIVVFCDQQKKNGGLVLGDGCLVP